jgi:plastocyanin
MTRTPFSRRSMLVGFAGLLALRGGGAQAHGAEHRIVIDKMKFGPAPGGLKVGDSILWVNADILRHTATARDGAFDVDMKPEDEAAVHLDKAGDIEVFCRFHPGMKLTLSVAG